MDREPTPTKGEFRSTVKVTVLCVLAAGVCLVLVAVVTKLLQAREPLVDLSRRSSVVTPADDTSDGGDRLRLAVATMVSAEPTFASYRRLVQRIARDVGRREAFIVPPSYADVRRALEQGQVDAAFVCTGTYARTFRDKQVELLVQPEFIDGLQYRCLLIVPTDSHSETIEELRGAVMAFTDPESNTGCFVPSAMLLNRGYDPKSYFNKVVFTGSHDRSILAVALGVVDAAAVDSLVWESNVRQDPSLARRVRVIWQSEAFGPPAFVVPVGLDAALRESLREALLAVDQDDEGREILSILGIKRFILPRPEDYETAVKLYEDLERRGGLTWP